MRKFGEMGKMNQIVEERRVVMSVMGERDLKLMFGGRDGI